MWTCCRQRIGITLDEFWGLSLRQIDGLLERHQETMRFEDILHARTAQSMRGGKIADILITAEREAPTARTPEELNQMIMAAMFAMGGEDTREN